MGVLQYFLCNYTLAHLKTAVLTLFFLCIYVFVWLSETKDAAFFVQKRLKIWEVRELLSWCLNNKLWLCCNCVLIVEGDTRSREFNLRLQEQIISEKQKMEDKLGKALLLQHAILSWTQSSLLWSSFISYWCGSLFFFRNPLLISSNRNHVLVCCVVVFWLRSF